MTTQATPGAPGNLRLPGCWAPSPDATVVALDFSQAEQAIAAYYSQLPMGRVHRFFDYKTAPKNPLAKNVNFGLLYGHGPKSIFPAPEPEPRPFELDAWVWSTDSEARSVIRGKVVGYRRGAVVLRLETPLPCYRKEDREFVLVSATRLTKPTLLERVAYESSTTHARRRFRRGFRMSFSRRDLRKATGY